MTLPTSSCQQGLLLQTDPPNKKAREISSGLPRLDEGFNQSDQNKFPENSLSSESEREFTTELVQCFHAEQEPGTVFLCGVDAIQALFLDQPHQ